MESVSRDTEGRRGPADQTYKGHKTFAEAVKVNNQKREAHTIEEKGLKFLSMFWSSHQREELWLRKCAMGMLKSFSKVECVNERLRNRGFQFSAHFLGAKSVLWCFESEIDKEGFINNRFFWEDCFASMRNWEESPVSNTRLVWINCSGIPLCYWSKEFFEKLGWIFGETLLVDEETSQRIRLDRGRILVQVRQEELVSTNVKVDVGKGSFTVKVMEEATQVDGRWVEQYLGLQKKESQDWQGRSWKNYAGEEDDRGTVGAQIGLRWQDRGMGGEELEVTTGEDRCQVKGRKVAARMKKASDTSSMVKSNYEFSFPNLHRKTNKGKEKEKWVPKTRKTGQRKGLGKVWIDEDKGQRCRGVISDSTSISVEERRILNDKKWRGECSRQEVFKEERETEYNGLTKENSQAQHNFVFSRSQSLDGPLKEFMKQVERGIGEKFNGLQKDGFSRSQSLEGPLKEYLENIEQAYIRATFLKGLSSQDVYTQSEGITLVPDTLSPKEGGVSRSVSVVQETNESTESDSSDSEEDEDGSSSDSASAVGKADEKVTDRTRKKTRKRKNRPKHKKDTALAIREGEGAETGDGDIEEEVFKVLEIGAVLVSSEGPSSILDVSAGTVVSISSAVSMVGQRSKVGRDSVSPLVSFAQPIVSSVVSIDELDDRAVCFCRHELQFFLPSVCHALRTHSCCFQGGAAPVILFIIIWNLFKDILCKMEGMATKDDMNITRVLFCGPYFPPSHIYTKEYLQNYPFIQVDDVPLADVPEVIANYHLCVVKNMRLKSNVISRAKQMKLIMQYGVGLEGVDIGAATNCGIKVARIPGDVTGNAASCAEMAIYLMLGLLRKQNEMQIAVKQKKLGEPIGETLLGKTLYIMGFGNIGVHLAKCLRPFGVKIIATKRSWASHTEVSSQSNALPVENGIICYNFNLA
ncbi:hypothetical protein LWI29_024638 [Acer saccharum]|uniref:D-isomer specific 2-hydroxyacid dehydrogenase catalytic domain-containing protein n=1 Tax=Acer saccharum TaxID=4024 RepID=A0AA39VZW6_ACESA|nr:hypothetical protein LWI29_024638 [Acer saccharum]